MAKLKNLNLDEVKTIVSQTYSSAEACRRLGMVGTSGSTTRFRKFLDNKQIDYSHWTSQRWSKDKTSLDDDRLRKTKDKSLIFTDNSNASSSYVRKLLLKHKLKDYKCESCNLSNEWNGKQINLQMDHINGNRKDHRLENLRWLCPNCHSQTDTFCARNSNRNTVSDEELREALLNSPNIRQALAKFDLENGHNYRRAKKLLRNLIDENNKISFMIMTDMHTTEENNKKCLVCDNDVASNKFDYCSQDCYKFSSRKVKDRPSREELIEQLKTTSYVQLGKKYGVSDNSIRKWLKTS